MRPVALLALALAACSREPPFVAPAFATELPGGTVLALRSGMSALTSVVEEFELQLATRGEVRFAEAQQIEVGWPSLAESSRFAEVWSLVAPRPEQEWIYFDPQLGIELLRRRLGAERGIGMLGMRALDAVGARGLGALLLAGDQRRAQGVLVTGSSRLGALLQGRTAPYAIGADRAGFELSLGFDPQVALAMFDALLEGDGDGSLLSRAMQAMPLGPIGDLRGCIAAASGTLWLGINSTESAVELGVRDRDAVEDALDRLPREVAESIRAASRWQDGRWRIATSARAPAPTGARPEPGVALALRFARIEALPGAVPVELEFSGSEVGLLRIRARSD
jgi:hypothetical protein